jgi:lipopolysaccharide transport system permease protein
MALFGVYPTWRLMALPALIVLTLLVCIGPSLLITSMNVKYRDFRYIIPFIVQFGLYVSPVGFSSQVIPEQWRILYNLNPMVGIIDGFRWCLLGRETALHLPGFMVGLAVATAVLAFGTLHFRKTEKTFADLI